MQAPIVGYIPHGRLSLSFPIDNCHQIKFVKKVGTILCILCLILKKEDSANQAGEHFRNHMTSLKMN